MASSDSEQVRKNIAGRVFQANGAVSMHSPIEKEMSGKSVEQVQREHTAKWMTVAGVVGTAIGEADGKACITILADSDAEQIQKKIPPVVDGYRVVIRDIGEIRALEDQ